MLASIFKVAYSADWTNFLQPLQSNCNTGDIYESLTTNSLPKNLKKSISKKIGRLEGEYNLGNIDFYLNNATFYGYRIKKISVNNDWDQGFIAIVFSDDGYTKLKSKFIFGDRSRMEKVGTKNFWIIDKNDNIRNFEFNKMPKTADSWSRFSEIYNPVNIYMTDYTGGFIEDHLDGRGSIQYLEVKNNSLICGWSLY